MKENVYTLLDLLLKTGQILLENGAETYRAENAVKYMFNGLCNGQVEVFALATMITIDIVIDKKHYTGTRRISKRSIDLSKIEKVNNISRNVCCGILGLQHALNAIDEIDCYNHSKKAVTVLTYGLAAGLFSLLIGGGAVEFIVACLSAFIVQIVGLFLKSKVMFYFLVSFIGGLIPALIATIVTTIFSVGNINIITIGAMLPFFPGVAMVNAIRDTMNGDLVSGVARGAEALLTAVGLAAGAMVGFSIGVLL